MLLPLTVGETHYLIDTGTAHAALRDFEVIKESALYWGNTSSYRAILVIVASDLLHIYKHYCCGATAGSEQQHNQDLKEIYIGATNSRIHHFLPQCIAFNQSALRHEQVK